MHACHGRGRLSSILVHCALERHSFVCSLWGMAIITEHRTVVRHNTVMRFLRNQTQRLLSRIRQSFRGTEAVCTSFTEDNMLQIPAVWPNIVVECMEMMLNALSRFGTTFGKPSRICRRTFLAHASKKYLRDASRILCSAFSAISQAIPQLFRQYLSMPCNTSTDPSAFQAILRLIPQHLMRFISAWFAVSQHLMRFFD